MGNGDACPQVKDVSCRSCPQPQTSDLGLPVHQSSLTPFLPVLCLPLPPCKDAGTSSVSPPSPLASCAHNNVGPASPWSAEVEAEPANFCESPASSLRLNASEAEKWSGKNLLSLSYSSSSFAYLDASHHICSACVSAATVVPNKITGHTAATLQELRQEDDVALSDAGRKHLQFDSLNSKEFKDLELLNQAPLAATSCTPPGAAPPLQPASCDVVSQTWLSALFDAPRTESQAKLIHAQDGIRAAERHNYLPQCHSRVRRGRVSCRKNHLHTVTRHASESSEEEYILRERFGVLGYTGASSSTVQPHAALQLMARKSESLCDHRGDTESPLSSCFCVRGGGAQATVTVVAPPDSSLNPSFSVATMQRSATKMNLVGERHTFSEVAKSRDRTNILASQPRGWDGTSSRKSSHSQRPEDSADISQSNECTTELLFSPFVQNEGEHTVLPCHSERQDPPATKTDSTIKTRDRRSASSPSICPAHVSPPAIHSGSALRSELKVAQEDLLHIVEGIAASKLAIRRAERLAARASREAAVAAHAATRAASAVADLLGASSQPLFKKLLFGSEKQQSATHLRSPDAEDTTALDVPAVDSVAAATVFLVSDGEDGIFLSESCGSSPLGVPRSRTQAYTPLGQSSLLSPSHRSTGRDPHTNFPVSSGNRRLRSSPTPPQQPNTHCEGWRRGGSQSSRLYETIPLDTSDLQGFFRLYLQSQAEQQKLLCAVRFSGQQQNQRADLGGSRGPHNKDGASQHVARVVSGGTSASAAVDSPCGTRQEVEKDTSAFQDSRQRGFLMAYHPRVRSASFSPVPKKQSLFSCHDELAATAQDGSFESLGGGRLETQAAEPQCNGLPAGRKASWSESIPCAVETAREDSEISAAQRLGLESVFNDASSFSAPGSAGPAVSIHFLGMSEDRKGGTESVRTVERRGTEYAFREEEGDLVAEGKEETTEIHCQQQAKQGHPSVGEQPPPVMAGSEPCCPMHNARQKSVAARGTLESPGVGDKEEKVKQNKRSVTKAGKESDFREKKLARTACGDGNAETVIHFDILQMKGSHIDVSHSGAEGADGSVSFDSNLELRDNSRCTVTESPLRRQLYSTGEPEALKLDLRGNAYPGEVACRPGSSEVTSAGHSSRGEAPAQPTLSCGSHAVSREKQSPQPQVCRLQMLVGNQRGLAECGGALTRCRRLPSMKKSCSHNQQRTAAEKSDAFCGAYAHSQPQRQPVEHMPNAQRGVSPERNPSCPVDGFKVTEVVDKPLCGSASKCGCGSVEAQAGRGRHEEHSRRLDPSSDEPKPRMLPREGSSIAQLQHRALIEEECGDLHDGQLDNAHTESATSRRQSNKSSQVSMQETAQFFVPLTAENRTPDTHLSALPFLRVHRLREETVPTGKEADRGCEVTACTDLAIVPQEDPHGREISEITTEEVTGGALPAAVKEENLHVAGDRRLQPLKTTFFEGYEQLAACGPRFQSVTVGQKDARVRGCQINLRKPMRTLAIESGNAKSGTGEGNTSGIGSCRRGNTTGCFGQDSANTTSQSTRAATCTSPPVRRSSRSGSTSDSGHSVVQQAVEQDGAPGSTDKNSSRRVSVVEGHSHDEMEVSQARRTGEGLVFEQSTRYCSSLQRFLQQCLPRKGPDGLSDDVCNSKVKGIDLDRPQRPKQRTGGEWIERLESTDGEERYAASANTLVTKVEEKNCKFMSNVPGVSYRSAPHCGWRFRWKDHENGKEYSRCFSVNKFGFQEAKRQAESIARDIRGRLPARRGRRWKPASGEAIEMNKDAFTAA